MSMFLVAEFMRKDKLVICDLDGTLFDTRRVNYMAYKEAIAKSGLPVTFDYEKYVKECWGPTYRGFFPIMQIPEDKYEQVHDLKKTLYEKNLHYAKENTHLFNIVEALKVNYHTAVVTSGSRNAKDILKYFKRDNFFDVVFTIDDVKHGKPDPEGFFKAMDFFKVKPEHTIIFEDSAVGIQAARKTGANVFVVDEF